MRHTVKLPKLGEVVTEVVVLELCCQPNDFVEEGSPLILVETDKVDTEVPAPVSGVVKALAVNVGDELEQGQIICVIESGDKT